MLHLMDVYCKPLLSYGSEVCCGAKTYDAALRRAWSCAFWKMFGVNEDVAFDIQLFTGIRTLEDTLKSRRVRFRRMLSHTGNDVITTLRTRKILCICFCVYLNVWSYVTYKDFVFNCK